MTYIPQPHSFNPGQRSGLTYIHTYNIHTHTYTHIHTVSGGCTYLPFHARTPYARIPGMVAGWLAGWLVGRPRLVAAAKQTPRHSSTLQSTSRSLKHHPIYLTFFLSFLSFLPSSSMGPPPDFSVKPSISKRAMYASCGEYTVADGEGKGREGKRGGGKATIWYLPPQLRRYHIDPRSQAETPPHVNLITHPPPPNPRSHRGGS